MSYAIRNGIVLAVVALLVYGGAFLYVRYMQAPTIEKLEQQVKEQEERFTEKSGIAEQLPDLQQQYDVSLDFIENYEKTLFRDSNPDKVFRFLTFINATSPLEFDFIFQDSTSTNQYGILRSEINGRGSYNAVLNFITRIEHSEPVQKIDNITITPVGQVGQYNEVTFRFNLASYYDNQRAFDPPETPDIAGRVQLTSHNPYFPLIRNVEPNEEGLVDVESSQITGITANTVFLRDQNGRLVSLRRNDRVYLGTLQTINLERGQAIFRLNKGGILETVTLQVQR
ncbi:MAG: type 4a pilus biogenesis protein PilO [Balneolaceae bacterium]